MSETFRPSLKGPPVYLALRDLLVARGRFALVGSVIALVSLLAGLLSGLAKTLKRWLGAQSRPRTASELQTLLGSWTTIYNQQRPHRSLDRRTPAVVYGLLPKATPAGSDAGTHHRIRYDTIDKRGAVSLRRAGRMHHIGIGRAHTGTKVMMLIDDLDIRVIATQTGELLRHLTLDPTRGYQPQK